MTCGEQADLLKFCFECWPGCQELEYCINMRRSKNCFGCVGMKDKKYCIFNIQYSKEEYDIQVAKIKKHMNELPYVDKRGNVYTYGEFFPIEISFFAYNETLLNDQFPSTKDQAEKDGFVWRDREKKEFVSNIVASDLPDSINEYNQDVTKDIIECSGCKKAYRIIFDEFQFLKNSGLPLPRYCHDCRFLQRQKFMVPPLLKQSVCACDGDFSNDTKYKNVQNHAHGNQKCGSLFQTAYNPDKEIIYCEDCYKKEVF
jgi:hypothetical protein